MKTKLFTRDFTLVIIGQVISLFGNAILRFALPLYLLRETGSAALFGLVTACSFLPMIVLSFLGGILADRVNKRNIMVVLDFLTASIITLLCLLLNIFPVVPLFLVVMMLMYGISGTYQPTVQASIPALVSEEHILSAGAIVNQIGALAGLLGPIVGGMLFGSFGLMPILLLSIVCFFASAVMEIFIHIPFTRRSTDLGVMAIIRHDVRDSLGYIKREKPVLLQMIVLIILFNLFMSAMLVVGLPILVIDTLQMSDAKLGFAQGALALGGLFGGMLTAVCSKKLRLSNANLLLVLCSASVLGMALPLLLHLPADVSYFVITATSFAGMALATMFSVQMLAAIQTETPPELVGKVIALMMSLSMCAQPVGQAIYGVLFDAFPNDTGLILLGAAIISGCIGLASKRVFRKIDA